MPVRLAALLSVIGKDCFKIYEKLPVSIQDREDIDKILEALDGHFMLKTNVIYERYTADQLSNESFDKYLCRLRELAKTCESGDIADLMIIDRDWWSVEDYFENLSYSSTAP